MTTFSRLTVWLVVVLVIGGLWGCGGRGVVDDTQMMPPPTPAPAPSGHPDQALLQEALQGRTLPPGEVVDLSDRLLTEGGTAFQDQQTLARLEMLLLKTLQSGPQQHRARVLRNLGIVHYHKKEYKRARQELQASNELNPRDARTHFYLARLFVHQGNIYQAQGKKKLSRQQLKRAAIEMQQARKLEPANPLYRQDINQYIQEEQGK